MQGSGRECRKTYKRQLERRHEITCGYCRYHRGENATKQPRSDRGKNHRRHGR